MSDRTKVTVNIGKPLWLLGLLFVGLKLTGNIDWSWVWVLCPFWIFPGFILSIIAFVMCFGLLVAVCE